MCFRPAGATLPDPICPECGKKLTMIGNVVLKKCPFCKCDLLQYAEAAGYSVNASTAPGAPKSPGAPGVPSAPKAPGVPGAPKAPGAPGAPKSPGAPGA